MLFKKIIICLLLNISMISHDKIFCHVKFWGYVLVCRNAEGYMVRGRLGAPVQKLINNF